MGYRRGFKSECEQLAHDTCRELKLDLKSPLAVTDLAEHLCIPVLATSDLVKFGATPEDIRRAERILSAFTVVVGTYKAIFYNPSHPTSRLANSLAHELSHILLEHVPTVAVVDRRRVWNADQEAEADWLAGALLVPREGAVRWR